MSNISNITEKYGQTYLNESTEKQTVGTSSNTTETVEADRSQNDRVSLSSASKEMQMAEEAVAAASDVRQEKVDEIRMAVESGEYEIAPEKIAENIMRTISEYV